MNKKLNSHDKRQLTSSRLWREEEKNKVTNLRERRDKKIYLGIDNHNNQHEKIGKKNQMPHLFSFIIASRKMTLFE